MTLTVMFLHRKLLSTCLRDPVRQVDGLLPDPDLHPVRPDRHHLLGELLAQQERDARQGGAGCHHRAHHDDADVVDERGPTQDILRQID